MTRRSGFTIIELFVLVGIVEGVSSFVFGVVGSARESARARECFFCEKRLANALLLYAETSDSPEHLERPWTSTDGLEAGLHNILPKVEVKCPDLQVPGGICLWEA